jgi:hypothetical protein
LVLAIASNALCWAASRQPLRLGLTALLKLSEPKHWTKAIAVMTIPGFHGIELC